LKQLPVATPPCLIGHAENSLDSVKENVKVVLVVIQLMRDAIEATRIKELEFFAEQKRMMKELQETKQKSSSSMIRSHH
jgi:hypothetical protein